MYSDAELMSVVYLWSHNGQIRRRENRCCKSFVRSSQGAFPRVRSGAPGAVLVGCCHRSAVFVLVRLSKFSRSVGYESLANMWS